MWLIEWSAKPRTEIRQLPAYDRVKIVHAIDQWLSTAPFADTGDRIKRLENLTVPWSQNRWTWQLKVGAYRVFYDGMDLLASEADPGIEGIVVIQAVRFKPHGKRTEELL